MSSAPSPSNSSAGPADDSGLNLSEADRKFLEAAITCLKNPPEVGCISSFSLLPPSPCFILTTPSTPQLDIQKLSARLGIKPKSVTNRWCDLKKKLFAMDAMAPSGGGASDGGPVTPAKKRKGAADTQGGSAAKKVAKPRAPKKKAAAAADLEEEADNGHDGEV